MENATKGLMIAGAILIAIVLIGIGVFLVSQAQVFMDRGGDQFDQMTIQSFNSQFENYSGKRSGSEVKKLISIVNTNNLTAHKDGTYAEQGIILIFNADGTEYEVNGMVEDYQSTSANKASNAANTGKTYYVSLANSNDTGLIQRIGISSKSQADADSLVAEKTAR